jgi:WD40 repeat protein
MLRDLTQGQSLKFLVLGFVWLSFGPSGQGQERLDGFGDPLPAGCLARFGTVRWRHTSPVYFVRYLPDGKHLLTATSTDGFQVWDIETEAVVRRFGWSRDGKELLPVREGRVQLTANGERLFAADYQRNVRVWDVATGKQVHEFKYRSAPKGA